MLATSTVTVPAGPGPSIDRDTLERHRRPPTVAEASARTDPILPPPRGLRAGLTRTFDVVGAIGIGLLFLPAIVAAGLAVKLTSRGPVVYRSSRLARFDGEFSALKFRSMVVDGDRVLDEHFRRAPEARREWEATMKLADDPRITRVGRWLRLLSLDELPQLWNVLKGEMSLVGPRPKLPEEATRYGNALPAVLSVRPGLTGLWQVSGRSSVSYEERISLDLRYVATRTLRGDIAICLRTARQLVNPDDGTAH